MELVTEKYKQTDVGILPSDWECKDLQYYFSFISYGFTNPMPTASEGVYMITANDINEGRIKFETARKTTEEAYKYLLSDKSRPKKNDILLTKDGSLGRLALVVDEKICINQSVAVIRPNDKVYPLFLKLLLEDTYYQRTMIDNAGGSTIKHIYITIVNKMQVGIPPTKAEQTLIATALYDADTLISSLEKLIAKKRNIKQGAMQKLLEPKEGWVHKTLGEIGEITGAGVDKLINENEVPIRLLNYMDVFKRDFISSNELNHWVTAPQSKIHKCAVRKGDIFFTPSSEMRFDIAFSAIAIEDIPDAAYSYHVVRLRLFEDWDLNFRTYIFKTKYFLSQAEQICEGSGKRYVITLPKFRSLKIYFPPDKNEQNKISTILSDIDHEINALEAKLAKYKNVKSGMMQKLLTGKIRLI